MTRIPLVPQLAIIIVFSIAPNLVATTPVSEKEREALVALYKATDGDHWTHSVGWLGPPGTECGWHGVGCGSRFGEPAKVTSLDLSENNLVGNIPPAFSQLTHLKELSLWGNRISDQLPQQFIERWLAGELDILAEASLLTAVTRIEFESDPSALLCGRRRISLDSDSRAALFTKRCRDATLDDRETFCEVKEGRVAPRDFAALGWLLEKNGFYGLRAEYSRSVTHATFETTRVAKAGKRYQVENYANAGPFELWVIQSAIQGVASSVEWEKSSSRSECPRWE